MKNFYLLLMTFMFLTSVWAQKNEHHEALLKTLKEKISTHGVINFEEDIPIRATPQKISKKGISQDIGNAPEWMWSMDFGGSGNDYGRQIISDEKGNVYIAGSFSGEILIDGQKYTTTGMREAFVAKWDANQNLIWFRNIPAQLYERTVFYDLTRDASGNVYATGEFSGTIQLEGQTWMGGGQKNLFFVKLDKSGNLLLGGSYQTTKPETQGMKIKAGEGGNFYILARSDSCSLMKFDQSGQLVWEIRENEYFADMEFVDDQIYIVGHTNSQGGNIAGEKYESGSYVFDLFIAKCDEKGNISSINLPGHNDFSLYSAGYEMTSTVEMVNVQPSLPDYFEPRPVLYLTGIFRNNIVLGKDTLTSSQSQTYVARVDTGGNILSGFTLNQYTWPNDIEVKPNIEETVNSHVYLSLNDMKLCRYNSQGALINENYKYYYHHALDINKLSGALTTTGYLLYCENTGMLYLSGVDNELRDSWIKECDGNSGSAEVIGLVTDTIGNLYIYGKSNNEVPYCDEGIGPGAFLAKHDPVGNLLWLKCFPKAQCPMDIGDKISLDSRNGGIFISGAFQEELAIPGGGSLSPEGQQSIFLLKFDTDGNFLWPQRIGHLSPNALDMSTDHSGNLIVSTIFNLNEGQNIQIGDKTYHGPLSSDVLLIKFDREGNLLWSETAGGEGQEYNGITSCDAEDNIYLTGEFTSNTVSIGNAQVQLHEGEGNIFMAKLDPQGQPIWMRSHGGAKGQSGSSDYLCWPTGITTLHDGYSYIKGWHCDSITFGDTILTNEYGIIYNHFIGLFDPQGDARWVHSIDHEATSFDYNQLNTDQKGNVYLGAQIGGCTHFKCFGTEHPCESTGQQDLFVARYSMQGNIDWVKPLVSRQGYSWVSAVAATDTHIVYVGGRFNDYLKPGKTFYAEGTHGFVARIGKDLNQAPTDISLSNNTILENMPVGTEIGLFSTSDPDPDDLHTYKLITGDGTNDADNDKFILQKDTLFSNHEFDYESQQQMQIYTQTTDAAGFTLRKEFTITVEDVDETSAIANNKEPPFRCFPNPIGDFLIIQCNRSHVNKQLRVEIYNTQGQIVINKVLEASNRHRIKTSILSNGTYIAKFSFADKIWKKKIVKE